MLGLPQSTEFNKRIPKRKFYEHMEVSPALKRAFVEQIKLIHWRNKLAVSTVNIAPGETVTEIEVIELKLAQPHLGETVLRQIDKEIPYHILFVLSYEDKMQAWIGYGEPAQGGKSQYFHTDWLPQDGLRLKIDGLNMDAVWENFVVQVGGIVLGQGRTLDEQLQIDARKAKLQNEIDRIEKHARRENQPNKKFQLAQQIKALKKELEGLQNG